MLGSRSIHCKVRQIDVSLQGNQEDQLWSLSITSIKDYTLENISKVTGKIRHTLNKQLPKTDSKSLATFLQGKYPGQLKGLIRINKPSVKTVILDIVLRTPITISSLHNVKLNQKKIKLCNSTELSVAMEMLLVLLNPAATSQTWLKSWNSPSATEKWNS